MAAHGENLNGHLFFSSYITDNISDACELEAPKNNQYLHAFWERIYLCIYVSLPSNACKSGLNWSITGGQ